MNIFVTDLAVFAPLSVKERTIVETLKKEKYDSNFRKSVEITLSTDKSKKTIVDMVSLLKKDKFEKVNELLHKMVLTCLDDFTSADWNLCKKAFNKICKYDDWVTVTIEASMVIVLDVLQKMTNREFSGFQIG